MRRLNYRRVPRAELRAARANRVFCTDKKRIRTENPVMLKSKDGSGLSLYKIADCLRMAFHPCAIDDPRGRLLVRATSQLCNNAGAI
jgi:hypothetical protein